VILIDYSGVALATIVAQKLPPEEDLIRHMILNTIRAYRKKYHAKYGELVICCDSPNNWRRAYYPHYKAKRREAREKDEGGMNWLAVFETMGKVRDELYDKFPYVVLQVEGCEADDIIGTLAEYTQEFGKHEPIMIISSDKDFMQLQRYNNVEQYSPARRKPLVERNALAYLKDHILSGDAGDGVPNVLSDNDVFVDPNKRQKPLTAKMRRQFESGEVPEEYVENLRRNVTLIDLTKTPKALKSETINKFEQQREAKESASFNVLNFLIEKKCTNLIDVIEDFV
jgi:5'-3' exonuclease